MATRAIVTSQPDVACDVCGRRLLRGERPETFLAGMERRTVCELCSPRAAYEGWVREAEAADSLNVPPSRRRRRGASLLGRLRQLREPAARYPGAELESYGEDARLHDDARLYDGAQLSEEADLSDEALDELVQNGGWQDEPLHSEIVQRELAQRHPAYGARPARGESISPQPPSRSSREPHSRQASDMASAVEAFNAGEHPRRIAGVARSLGAPTVTVRAVEDGASRRFTIVVAWELCWYRYEVDLDDPGAGARLLEKGMELHELPEEDRAANAAAGEHGELLLALR